MEKPGASTKCNFNFIIPKSPNLINSYLTLATKPGFGFGKLTCSAYHHLLVLSYHMTRYMPLSTDYAAVARLSASVVSMRQLSYTSISADGAVSFPRLLPLTIPRSAPRRLASISSTPCRRDAPLPARLTPSLSRDQRPRWPQVVPS